MTAPTPFNKTTTFRAANYLVERGQLFRDIDEAIRRCISSRMMTGSTSESLTLSSSGTDDVTVVVRDVTQQERVRAYATRISSGVGTMMILSKLGTVNQMYNTPTTITRDMSGYLYDLLEEMPIPSYTIDFVVRGDKKFFALMGMVAQSVWMEKKIVGVLKCDDVKLAYPNWEMTVGSLGRIADTKLATKEEELVSCSDFYKFMSSSDMHEYIDMFVYKYKSLRGCTPGRLAMDEYDPAEVMAIVTGQTVAAPAC